MSGVLDTLGDFGGAALDFISPDMGRRGAGFGVGDLMKAAGDAFNVTPLGGLTQLPNLLIGDTSWGEKLLYGGLIAGGAALGAHQWHAARKLERQFAASAVGALEPTVGYPVRAIRPTRSTVGRSLGLPERFAPSTLEGEAILRQVPGVTPRAADILGSADVFETARHLTDLADEGQIGYAANLVQSYADRLDIDPAGRLGAAQGDLAKLRSAFDQKVITKTDNPELKDLWDRFSTNPESLANTPDGERFLGLVREISDATRGLAHPDLSVDALTRVERIVATDHGPAVHLSTPIWDAPPATAAERSARLKEFNLAQLADHAYERLTRLYNMGIEQQERFLDRSTDWYGWVHDETLSALADVQERMPWLDHERLTAAVAITSAATEWDSNIALAVRALDTISSDPRFSSAEFQDWLRATTTAKSGDGSEFQTLFDKVHDELTSKTMKEDLRPLWEQLPKKGRPTFTAWLAEQGYDGNFLSKSDLKKTMRLFSEEGQGVMASMADAPKQKNFYLNMLDPDAAEPLTVDRHAIDGFFGFATHSDFKVIDRLGAYETIADVYRRVAADQGVRPNQVQGVSWQVIRTLKREWNVISNNFDRGRGPWSLPEPDGTPNAALEALQGRPSPLVKDVFSAVPTGAHFITGGTGRGLTVLPDGSAGVLTHWNNEAAQTWRHLRPAVERPDGVAMLAPGYPQPVADVQAVLRELDQLETHHAQVFPADAWEGLHPALRPGRWAILEVPDGTQVPNEFAKKMTPAGGRVMIHEPEPPLEGLRKVDRAEFIRARRALEVRQVPKGGTTADKMLSSTDDLTDHHRFWLNDDGSAGFSIAPDGDLQQVFNSSPVKGYGGQMVEFAKRMGAHKLDFYDGEFLPDGSVGPGYLKDFYGKHGFEPTERYPWDPQYDKAGRPVGPDVQYMGLGDAEPRGNGRTSRPATLVAVELTQRHTDDLQAAVAAWEKSGVRVQTVYAPGAPPKGWAPVREHFYSDGVNQTVVRTADRETVSAHGYTGWVPKAAADELPRSNPLNGKPKAKVSATTVPNGVRYGQFATADVDVLGSKVRAFTVDLSATPPRFQSHAGALFEDFDNPKNATAPQPTMVRKIGDRFVINAEDPLNITDQVKIVDTLKVLGVKPEKIQLNVGTEAAKLDIPEPKATKGKVLTQNGLMVEEARRASVPVRDWLDRHGVQLYPVIPDTDGTMVRLHDDLLPVMDAGLTAFMADPTRAEIAQVAGFGRIGMARYPADWPQVPLTEQASAWYLDGLEGPIQLNARLWADPEVLRSVVVDMQSVGHFNPTLPPDASALLGHELGHAMLRGVLLSFERQGDSEMLKKTLRQLRRQLGRKNIEAGLSKYAYENIDEMVAESVAEVVLNGTRARPIARQVYTLLEDQFVANRKPLVEGMGWNAASA